MIGSFAPGPIAPLRRGRPRVDGASGRLLPSERKYDVDLRGGYTWSARGDCAVGAEHLCRKASDNRREIGEPNPLPNEVCDIRMA